MALQRVLFVHQEQKNSSANRVLLAEVDSSPQVVTVHAPNAQLDSVHQRQAVVYASRVLEVLIQKKALQAASSALQAPFQVKPVADATVVKGSFCGQCLMPRSKAVKLIAFRCFFLRHLLLHLLVSVSCF